MGTTLYAAPEVVRLAAGDESGQAATPLMDAFSAGVLFFELLTGQLPWVPAAATSKWELDLAYHTHYLDRVRHAWPERLRPLNA